MNRQTKKKHFGFIKHIFIKKKYSPHRFPAPVFWKSFEEEWVCWCEMKQSRQNLDLHILLVHCQNTFIQRMRHRADVNLSSLQLSSPRPWWPNKCFTIWDWDNDESCKCEWVIGNVTIIAVTWLFVTRLTLCSHVPTHFWPLATVQHLWKWPNTAQTDTINQHKKIKRQQQ